MDLSKNQIEQLIQGHWHVNDEEISWYLDIKRQGGASVVSQLEKEEYSSVEDHLRHCHICFRKVEKQIRALEGSESFLGRDDLFKPHEARSYTKFWVGDDTFEIRGVESEPSNLEIVGLTSTKLRQAIEEDRKDPGSVPLGIEGPGLQPILGLLSQLNEVDEVFEGRGLKISLGPNGRLVLIVDPSLLGEQETDGVVEELASCGVCAEEFPAIGGLEDEVVKDLLRQVDTSGTVEKIPETINQGQRSTVSWHEKTLSSIFVWIESIGKVPVLGAAVVAVLAIVLVYPHIVSRLWDETTPTFPGKVASLDKEVSLPENAPAQHNLTTTTFGPNPVIALSSIRWDNANDDLVKLMSPKPSSKQHAPLVADEKKVRAAIIVLFPKSDDALTPERIETLYNALKPDDALNNRFDFVSPEQIKEAMANGWFKSGGIDGILNGLKENLKVSKVLFVGIQTEGSDFGVKGEVVDVTSGKVLKSRSEKGVLANQLPLRVRETSDLLR